MAYEITEDLAQHYDAIREARGWSWAILADYFDQQTVDPASPALARWARSQAEAAPSTRARSAAKETRGGSKSGE